MTKPPPTKWTLKLSLMSARLVQRRGWKIDPSPFAYFCRNLNLIRHEVTRPQPKRFFTTSDILPKLALVLQRSRGRQGRGSNNNLGDFYLFPCLRLTTDLRVLAEASAMHWLPLLFPSPSFISNTPDRYGDEQANWPMRVTIKTALHLQHLPVLCVHSWIRLWQSATVR